MQGELLNNLVPINAYQRNTGCQTVYTPLEELIYTFGGPWPFALLLSCVLVLLALLLSTLRIKFVGSDSVYHTANSIERQSHHHFPYLLSLSEVLSSVKVP